MFPRQTPEQLDAQLQVLQLKQWKALFSRINEPVTAALIVESLDEDPALKVRFSGFYVKARETIERSRIRHNQAKRIGQAVSGAFAWLRSLAAKSSAPSPAKVSREPLVWPELNQ